MVSQGLFNSWILGGDLKSRVMSKVATVIAMHPTALQSRVVPRRPTALFGT